MEQGKPLLHREEWPSQQQLQATEPNRVCRWILMTAAALTILGGVAFCASQPQGGLAAAFATNNEVENLSGSFPCPGSRSFVHASCRAAVKISSSCDTVMEEIKARFSGQPSKWHDPHNNGTYFGLELVDTNHIEFLHETGNKKYTDRIGMSLSDNAEESSCTLRACSESQVFSVGDFSTNYCTMFNLYCSSSSGCKPVKHDWTFEELAVKPSIGAQASKSNCLLV